MNLEKDIHKLNILHYLENPNFKNPYLQTLYTNMISHITQIKEDIESNKGKNHHYR